MNKEKISFLDKFRKWGQINDFARKRAEQAFKFILGIGGGIYLFFWLIIGGDAAMQFLDKVAFGEMTTTEFQNYIKEHNLATRLTKWSKEFAYRLES